MANPMALTLAQYNTGVANFQAHYFLDQCSTGFTGQDIQISWSDFAGAVNSFINNNSLDPASVALRFVFCYDASNINLYLRLQILTMTADPVIPNQYNLNANPSVWYEITNGSIASTNDHSQMDSTFFNNFFYCSAAACSEGSLQSLGAHSNKYTQNVIFPWSAEVEQMYADNNNPTGGNIGFTTSSFQAAEGAPTMYPETLVIYLTDAEGVKLIDNSQVAGFQNKAADMSGLCPQYCHIYVMPV